MGMILLSEANSLKKDANKKKSTYFAKVFHFSLSSEFS